MITAIFDTLAYSKKLRAVGFTEQQAEVQAEGIAELIDTKLATKDDIHELEKSIQALAATTKKDIENLALATKKDIEGLALTTKKDIEGLAFTTKKDIQDTSVRNKTDLKELSYKLTIQTGLMLVGVVALLGTLIKL